MKIESNIDLIFKNKEGDFKKITITVKDMLERTLDDFYEDLEDECTNSGCNNESQNFCDCGPSYEDYEIYEICEVH
jgi:hypothetical protein